MAESGQETGTAKPSWPRLARLRDFDERLWPVNCTILMLAGFVAGIVFASSSFDDPRPFYNGWVRLGAGGVDAAAFPGRDVLPRGGGPPFSIFDLCQRADPFGAHCFFIGR